MALTGERVPDRRRMSASTIIFTSAVKSTSGSHPSFCARLGRIADQMIDLRRTEQLRDPDGRSFFQSRPTCSKANSTSSRTEWLTPVAMT